MRLILLTMMIFLRLTPALAEENTGEMVYVEEGEFIMGIRATPHKVYLSSYYIDIYEVPNFRYNDFVRQNNQKRDSLYRNNPKFNLPHQPVVGVSWYDAQTFCQREGKRLPTEAEWEKAASWDSEKRKKYYHPWGDVFDEARLNFLDNWIGQTAPIGSFEAGKSPYGVYDMAGNVWEWTADWYDGQKAEKRVIRGGSWGTEAAYTTTIFRGFMEPEYRFSTIGFRCAKEQGNGQ